MCACVILPYGEVHALCIIEIYSVLQASTHAVVNFTEDGTTALVLIKKLKTSSGEEVKVGECYNIKWTDKNLYQVTIQATGILTQARTRVNNYCHCSLL